jgi:hypothetical protein
VGKKEKAVVTCPPSTTAPVVSLCGRNSPPGMMCWTFTPFATRKSLTSRRWHCQNSPSAHMIAVRFRRPTSSSFSTPSRNSSVSM